MTMNDIVDEPWFRGHLTRQKIMRKTVERVRSGVALNVGARVWAKSRVGEDMSYRALEIVQAFHNRVNVRTWRRFS